MGYRVGWAVFPIGDRFHVNLYRKPKGNHYLGGSPIFEKHLDDAFTVGSISVGPSGKVSTLPIESVEWEQPC